MSFNEKLHRYLFLLLIFVIPSGFYNIAGPIMGLIFINWAYLNGFKKIHQIPIANIMLIGFFIILVFNYLLFYSSDSFTGILKHISFLLIPLTLTELKIKKEDIKIAQITFISSSIFFILIADIFSIVDIFITRKSTVFIAPNIFNKYSYYGLTRIFRDWHPTYVSFFLNASLLCLLNIYSQKKYDFKFMFLVTLIVLNIFLLDSLIGIISLFIFPISFVISKNYSKKLLLIIGVLIIMFSIIIIDNPFKIEKISQIARTGLKITDVQEDTNSLTIRLVKWKTGIEVFAENPILGVGMNNVKSEMVKKYIENGYLNAAEYKYSPHNQYLFFAVALGFFGLLFYLLILFFCFCNCSSTLEVLILILFVFFSITEEMLSRQQGLVFFALFYSLVNINKCEFK